MVVRRALRDEARRICGVWKVEVDDPEEHGLKPAWFMWLACGTGSRVSVSCLGEDRLVCLNGELKAWYTLL